MEQVVLLSPSGTPIGQHDKSTVHTDNTPFHLAFSCFVFRTNGELILQQRAHSKKTWPGIWSNSVCGHPAPNEPMKEAVLRRLSYEIGIPKIELINMLPTYRYKAIMNGVMENELCPVWVGVTDIEPIINPEEVARTQSIPWSDLIENRMTTWSHLSPWCREEMLLLHSSKMFQNWWNQHINTPIYS